MKALEAAFLVKKLHQLDIQRAKYEKKLEKIVSTMTSAEVTEYDKRVRDMNLEVA